MTWRQCAKLLPLIEPYFEEFKEVPIVRAPAAPMKRRPRASKLPRVTVITDPLSIPLTSMNFFSSGAITSGMSYPPSPRRFNDVVTREEVEKMIEKAFGGKK